MTLLNNKAIVIYIVVEEKRPIIHCYVAIKIILTRISNQTICERLKSTAELGDSYRDVFTFTSKPTRVVSPSKRGRHHRPERRERAEKW